MPWVWFRASWSLRSMCNWIFSHDRRGGRWKIRSEKKVYSRKVRTIIDVEYSHTKVKKLVIIVYFAMPDFKFLSVVARIIEASLYRLFACQTQSTWSCNFSPGSWGLDSSASSLPPSSSFGGMKEVMSSQHSSSVRYICGILGRYQNSEMYFRELAPLLEVLLYFETPKNFNFVLFEYWGFLLLFWMCTCKYV